MPVRACRRAGGKLCRSGNCGASAPPAGSMGAPERAEQLSGSRRGPMRPSEQAVASTRVLAGGRHPWLVVAVAMVLVVLAVPGLARAETVVTLGFDDTNADQYAVRPMLSSHG